jgi:hypothetical protein
VFTHAFSHMSLAQLEEHWGQGRGRLNGNLKKAGQQRQGGTPAYFLIDMRNSGQGSQARPL